MKAMTTKKARILTALLLIFFTFFSVETAAASSGPEAAKTLEILAQRDIMEKLDGWIRGFEIESEIDVNVEYISNYEDYLTVLATRIMSDDAPDLFTADRTSWQDFAKKGVLADFMPFIESASGKPLMDYETNILDGLRAPDGKLYVFPLSYAFDAVYVNEPLAQRYGVKIPEEWTWKNFIETCVAFTNASKEDRDVYAISGGADMWMYAMHQEIYAKIDLWENTADFDGITEFFKLFSRASNSSNFSMKMFGGKMDSAIDELKGREILFYPVRFSLGNAGYGSMRPLTEKSGTLTLKPFPRLEAGSGSTFIPELTFAMSESGDKDAAWEFLLFLSSSGRQTEMPGRNVADFVNPINASARNSRIQLNRRALQSRVETATPESLGIFFEEYGMTPEEFSKAYETAVSEFLPVRDGLVVPYMYNHALDSIIARALAGGIVFTKPTAARDELESKINLYLSEGTYESYENGEVPRLFYMLAAVAVLLACGIAFDLTRKKRRRN